MMKPTLSPYLDIRPPTTEEFNRLVDEIEDALRRHVPDDAVDRLKRQLNTGARFLSNEDLGAALGCTGASVSMYRNGKVDVSDTTIRLLRVLHQRVTEHPKAGAQAFTDFLDRHESRARREDKERRQTHLTAWEAMEVLDMTRTTIYGLIDGGVLRAERGDRDIYLIRREDVEAHKKKLESEGEAQTS